jgi:alpha-amylase
VRDRVQVTAAVVPEHPDDVVTFERRVGDGPWTAIGTDSSSPVYTVADDISALAPGTSIQYRATLDGAVTSAVRSVEVAPPPLTTAFVHYRRPGGDYTNWGLHLWGDAIADGVATDWGAPRQPTGFDAFGAVFEIPLKDDTKPVNFIVHLPGRDDVPTGREPGGDRSFVPLDHQHIYLVQGDPAIHFTPPP